MDAEHLYLTVSLSPSVSGTNTIVDSRHPTYGIDWPEWEKWRLTYEGGRRFIDRYLYKFSDHESDTDLLRRKCIAFDPAFATAAVEDVKNSIFQRIADVTRQGGPDTYSKAVAGDLNGVDYESSTMGTFIGTNVISELLVMRKVGVLVDNFSMLGSTQYDKGDKHPYLSRYTCENILNWAPKCPVNGYTKLLLREIVDDYDDWGLPKGLTVRYRYMEKTDDGINVTFYNDKGDITETTVLQLEKIPFALFEIERSLLQSAADYQIALLNLESSDINFIRNSNFPFYYEFFEPRSDPTFMKPVDGTNTVSETKSRDNEIKVGTTRGRRIPKGLDAPGFIGPTPENLLASMKKQEQLKNDIRSVVNLNLQALNPRRQSAESKGKDSESLEAGLSFVGLVLQKGEQQIAEYWSAFEGSKSSIKVSYPKTYSLKTEEQRRTEAKELDELADNVPSDTFRRAMKKKIARVTLGSELTEIDLDKIDKEIDAAPVLTSDPDILLRSQEQGLIDDVTCSTALGFDGPTTVPKAKEDQAERLAMTLEAQAKGAEAARGGPLKDDSSSKEKEGKPKRGEAS